jgi:hypothetical protein
MPWYTDYQRPFRCKDQPFDKKGKKLQFCLGPGCSKNSISNPETPFKQCGRCRAGASISSVYCSRECQLLDWPARHQTLHRALIFHVGEPNGYFHPEEYRGHAIPTGPEHEWTHAIYMVIREANLDNAIQALMREHGIENAGDKVLYQLLDSPLLEGRSEWSGPVQDAITLNDDHAANQDIMRGRLFLALRGFIRALLRLVYETPEHAAYNSRSIQLQDEEFIGRRLDGNRWRADLMFATALPFDEIRIVIEGSECGQYFVEFHHTREWLLFRYRNMW